ncbi:maleylpyruvate isomerase family mycothiol-dependent enzyme [Antrihabitans sp. YC2-6]|uniref:maleylpyruvate isomerase family mycothiol-dependent enzyme n=1 Tax=Antrihabitans sp. YC2-6 TaxID=2799498 RepID=UPI0018F33A71|nr:maleylpyruvate isomerase family mycothiol-dependent enzyme [Antrihabitans sp. YC2-6]MBJ8348266.1 maleylpyruvate isomerase family mycothiol-dependent enzyme [Antrihabitans sp. YC2-6]
MFHDLPLAERLVLARRGTSFFAQQLGELSDDELAGPTLLDGWTRKHVIAHVAYNAAALCRLLDWAASGTEIPMYASVQQRNDEISAGATLSAGALRNLFDHTVARLDEKWRHLADSAWDAEVVTVQGRIVPAAETAWMRAREVWIHAVDLAGTGRFTDLPAVVLTSVLSDIVKAWRTNELGSQLVLDVSGTPPIAIKPGHTAASVVRGNLASIVRWSAGRGAVGVTSPEASPVPPRWL